MRQLGYFLTLILASLGLALPLNAAIIGHLGGTLEEAQKTEFFSWFHLGQTASQSRDGKIVVSFKPRGPKFHRLVTVNITTSAKDRLQAVELVLHRSFIDSLQEGLFARDLTKSFLLVALTPPRDREVTDLINEIQYQGTSSRPVLRHKSLKPPKLPRNPTPGYLTYLGRRPAYEHRLPGFWLRLENTTREGISVLVVSIRKGQGRGQAK